MNLRFKRRLLREYARYFLNNGIGAEARRRFTPALISKALEFEYIRWPKRLESHVRGRDVLDVGCGMGLHGVGFAVSGVKSYTGCDPILDLDSDRLKNSGTGQREPCGWTPNQITARFPQLRYVAGSTEALPADQQWDAIVLHNTTEHLIDIAQVFASLSALLKENGRFIFNHHNFYAWNGHHLRPKGVEMSDPADPEQCRVLDWAHLTPDDELSARFSTRLNRIRLDELRALTERHFEICEWREILSNESEGRSRLTEEILMRHRAYSRRELETQSVFCVARKLPGSRAAA